MLMLGRGCTAAGVLLILALSFCPQTVLGEESVPTNVADTVQAVPAEETELGDRCDWAPGALPEPVLLPAEGEDSGSFFCQELSTFQSGPAWYLVGRIHNKADLAAELTLITWEVGNDDQEVVAAAQVYVRFLNPGESKPFKLMLPYRADITRYRVRLTPGFKARPRPVQFTATAEPYGDRGPAYISLLGQLTSTGPERLDFVKVLVEFLDESGQLLDVDWAFLNYLDPGETQSFTVYTPRLQACKWRICLD